MGEAEDALDVGVIMGGVEMGLGHVSAYEGGCGGNQGCRYGIRKRRREGAGGGQ